VASDLLDVRDELSDLFVKTPPENRVAGCTNRRKGRGFREIFRRYSGEAIEGLRDRRHTNLAAQTERCLPPSTKENLSRR
jgi:hypothetical protein